MSASKLKEVAAQTFRGAKSVPTENIAYFFQDDAGRIRGLDMTSEETEVFEFRLFDELTLDALRDATDFIELPFWDIGRVIVNPEFVKDAYHSVNYTGAIELALDVKGLPTTIPVVGELDDIKARLNLPRDKGRTISVQPS